MNLQAGYRLVVAPAFHLPVRWEQRLSVGAGVERDGPGFVPRTDWRAATAGELDLLVADGSGGGDPGENCLSLFCLPQHLLHAWDRMLEQAARTGKPVMQGLDAFAHFASEVAEFLAFKGLALPAGAVFDLLICKSGQRSSCWNAGVAGMSFHFDAKGPLSEQPRTGSQLWGVLNMGTDPSRVVFINLSEQALLTEVERRGVTPLPDTFGELGERFFLSCPDYPPVCLRLEPGEGFRFPDSGLLVDGCTLDSQQPDLLLLIRRPEQ